MLKVVTISLLILAILSCGITPNQLQLLNAKPVLLKQTTNGQKLIIGDLNDPDRNYIFIANLKGTPYEMGKAFGELFQDELKDMLKIFYDYYKDQIAEILDKRLPKFMASFVDKQSKSILQRILDLNVLITKRYTNKRYYQEIRGIAKGAGVRREQIARINLLPQLVKAACTVAGVWNVAANNNHTLHMRALDWDSNNPMQKYPLISVYHPSNKNWQTHANIGWVGFVGSLTGISTKVTLGEKVWLPPKNSVSMTRYGNPWTYVFRDILYDATNLQTAIQILSTTHRTCAIHIGLASVQQKSFRMMQYSYQTLNIYDDNNYTHYTKSHPKKAGIAYFDKHVQPSGDDCVGYLLTHPDYYGKWTMDTFWRVVGQSHRTGNTQLVVFDLEQLSGYISYSKYNGGKGAIDAFIRRPIFVDFKELFSSF